MKRARVFKLRCELALLPHINWDWDLKTVSFGFLFWGGYIDYGTWT